MKNGTSFVDGVQCSVLTLAIATGNDPAATIVRTLLLLGCEQCDGFRLQAEQPSQKLNLRADRHTARVQHLQTTLLGVAYGQDPMLATYVERKQSEPGGQGTHSHLDGMYGGLVVELS